MITVMRMTVTKVRQKEEKEEGGDERCNKDGHPSTVTIYTVVRDALLLRMH